MDAKEPDVGGSDEESEDTLNVTIGSKMSSNNRCDYRLFKCIDAAGDTRLMAIVDAKKTIDVNCGLHSAGGFVVNASCRGFHTWFNDR